MAEPASPHHIKTDFHGGMAQPDVGCHELPDANCKHGSEVDAIECAKQNRWIGLIAKIQCDSCMMRDILTPGNFEKTTFFLVQQEGIEKPRGRPFGDFAPLFFRNEGEIQLDAMEKTDGHRLSLPAQQ